MRKNFLLPFVAALTLTGCSNNEPVPNGSDENSDGDGYLAISIATTPEGGSRTAGEQYGTTFEDGLAEENTVNSVRFYFFSNTGQPVIIDKAHKTNYYNWTAPKGTDEDHTNATVERILNAVVVISTKESGVIPSQVIAVVNPEKTALNNTNYSREVLRGAIDNYAKQAIDDKSFVMTNSVYMAQGTSDRIYYATIAAENIQANEEDAKKHPVTIYVERNVAKVRIKSSLSTTDVTGADGKTHKLLKLQGGQRADITVDDGQSKPIQVYLDLEGWNVTSTVNDAYLLKHLGNWDKNLFGTISWNAPQYFRSYWAASLSNYSGKNQFGDFNDAHKIALGGHTYCNENAEKNDVAPLLPTQVIFAGTLCDEKANPLTICEFASSRMIGEDALKALYLGMIQTSDTKYYYKKTEKDSEGKDVTVYVQIGTKSTHPGDEEEGESDYSDIQFISHKQALDKKLIKGTYEPGVFNSAYYSYCCLTEDAHKKTWYTFDAAGNPQNVKATDIEKKLIENGHAKIWKSGLTYYFQDIEHIRASNQTSDMEKEATIFAGVVRNHIYEYNLKSILGLGTPVYNPDEIIYPEYPNDNDSYIAAQVKILSWRVVSTDLTLNWGD